MNKTPIEDDSENDAQIAREWEAEATRPMSKTTDNIHFSSLASEALSELNKVTAQRDTAVAALRQIERRTRGGDGSNQHPSGALRSIARMAQAAIAALRLVLNDCDSTISEMARAQAKSAIAAAEKGQ